MTPQTKTHQKHFVNDRGEHVLAELFDDPQRGETYRAWAAHYFPYDIFRALRMIDTEGSDEWLNVVEHCIFVAAASLTLARELKKARVAVDEHTVVQAAMVHDAAKRIDVEHHKKRESEAYDTLLANELVLHGYSFDVIVAAMNTGRAADRYIADPRIRMDHIKAKGVEAAVVGYCDARIRGSHIYSLDNAKAANLAAKQRREDEQFFSHYWPSYYRSVEAYLRHLAPTIDLPALTDDYIYETIAKEVHGPTA